MASELLVSSRFDPWSEGHLIPSFLADQLDCEGDEALAYLTELESKRFLERQDPKRFKSSSEPHFSTTEHGWRAAEDERRKRRLRRPPLLDQRSYDIMDLILAIAWHPHAINARLRGALGHTAHVPIIFVHIYLADWTEDEIREACLKLDENRMLALSDFLVRQRSVASIQLTERGRRRYHRVVCTRLHLADRESILDPPPSTLKLFFAWQSECKPSRNILSDAVPSVIEKLNKRGDLLRTLELDQATQRLATTDIRS